MNKNRILAHRGYWRKPNEQNNISAIKLALQKGFGVETDVRDLNGNLVISHDPPKLKNIFDLASFCKLVVQTKSTARLALNIKADGLYLQLKKILLEKLNDLSNLYVFDMSVPDTVLYRRIQFPYYTPNIF